MSGNYEVGRAAGWRHRLPGAAASRPLRLASVALALALVAPGMAHANSSGIPEYSGKQSATKTCANCHGGGQTPDVAFEGPTEMLPGATATFRFVVQSNGASQRHSGLGVAASGGVLAIIEGQGTRLMQVEGGAELVHTAAKQNSSGKSTFDFNWTAPSTPGFYSLYGAGNSVNRNGATTGDRSNTTVLNVQVMDVADTATPTPTDVPPTETPTSPPTATETPVPTSTRRDTPTATSTRTPAEPTATATPSGTATPTEAPAPSPGDANCDGEINAADLAATLRLMENGGELGECVFADGNCDGAIDEGDLDVLFSRVFGGPVSQDCIE